MANAFTNQYGLIRISTVEIGFPQNLWGRAINYNDGFSRELFREGRHLRSIRSDGDTQLARRGDTILMVNLGVITLTFSGSLSTQDRYTLGYDAAIIVRVWDARTFAVCYQQEIDPLDKVRAAIHAMLLNEIEQLPHDKVSSTGLRYNVEHLVGMPVRDSAVRGASRQMMVLSDFGIAIVEAQRMTVRPDPRRQKDIEEAERKERARKEEAERVQREKERLEKDKQIELARRQTQADLERERIAREAALAQQKLATDAKYDEAKQKSDFALAQQRRERDEWQSVLDLEDDARRKDHERAQRRRDALNDAAVEMQIRRARLQFDGDMKLLSKLLEEGLSAAVILEEYPHLDYLLNRGDPLPGLPPTARRPELKSTLTASVDDAAADDVADDAADGDVADNAAAGDAADGGAAPETTHSVVTEERGHDSDYDILIDHLGVRAVLATLDATQMANSNAPSGQALLVRDLLSHWQGEQQLKNGDLIFRIADEGISDKQSLAARLNAAQRKGEQVKVEVLRGDPPRVFLITIPPASGPERSLVP